MSTLRIKILEDGLKPLYEKRVNVEGDAGVDLYFPINISILPASLDNMSKTKLVKGPEINFPLTKFFLSKKICLRYPLSSSNFLHLFIKLDISF